MTRRDWAGLAVVAVWVAALVAYRHTYIEPREWGAICAAAAAPLVCAPRAALLWLQFWQLWGAAALALGLAAFVGVGFWAAVGAVALGAAAVIDYNATWGMLGLALGAWAWITRRPTRGPAARP
jgi:hypothetical protein